MNRNVVLPNPEEIFLTVVDNNSKNSRRGLVKIHSGLSRATSALGAQKTPIAGRGWLVNPGKIYRLVDAQWVLIYELTEHTPEEELPWKK